MACTDVTITTTITTQTTQTNIQVSKGTNKQISTKLIKHKFILQNKHAYTRTNKNTNTYIYIYM